MYFKAKSSTSISVSNGNTTEVIAHCEIIIDTSLQILKIRKSKLPLLNIEEKTFALKQIQNIIVDKHIFGANIYVYILGTTFSVLYMQENDAEKIRDIFYKYTLKKDEMNKKNF